MKVTRQVEMRPQSDSEPFVITSPFNIMYHFFATNEGYSGPAFQFDAKAGEICVAEIKIPESGVGKDPWGQWTTFSGRRVLVVVYRTYWKSRSYFTFFDGHGRGSSDERRNPMLFVAPFGSQMWLSSV